jgi:hypothetical protein
MSLQLISCFRNDWEKTCQATINVCQHMAITGDSTAISQAREQTELSYGQVQNAEVLAMIYEVMLNILEWWTATSEEFMKYHKENIITSFGKAVDEVERAVVMRIWELSKMKESGTGMSNHYQGFMILK